MRVIKINNMRMSYGIILLSCMLLAQKIVQCQSETVISLVVEVAAATQANQHFI